MRNHHHKARDMARSVLPSGIDDGQRWRRRIHHIERGRVHPALRHAVDVDDRDDVALDLSHTERNHLREFVRERRYADRVNALVRWASRVVEASPELREAALDDRLRHFRRVLPDNLIGQHALGHLELAWELAATYGRRPGPRPDRRAELLDAVDTLLSAGALGELNRTLKRCRIEVLVERHDRLRCERQPVTERLRGLHDRERFVDAVHRDDAICDAVVELARRYR